MLSELVAWLQGIVFAGEKAIELGQDSFQGIAASEVGDDLLLDFAILANGTDDADILVDGAVGKERSVKLVDWAFYLNGRPIFLVEAKDAGKKLGGYDEQLGNYFGKVADVKLGVLTNGVLWRFFTDIISVNRMDTEPFAKWDVLNDEQPPYDLLTLLQKSKGTPCLRNQGVLLACAAG